MNQPSVSRTTLIPEKTPIRPEDLIADTSARVRLDTHTRQPVRRIPTGNSPEIPISGTAQLNQWISKSKVKKSSPGEPIRGGRCIIL